MSLQKEKRAQKDSKSKASIEEARKLVPSLQSVQPAQMILMCASPKSQPTSGH